MKRLLISALLTCFVTSYILAKETVLSASAQLVETSAVTFFGPNNYERTAGPKNVYEDSLYVPAWITSPYVLHVYRANSEDKEEAPLAWIEIDGVEVVGPSDFKKKTESLELRVDLKSTSQLKVTLSGKPGSSLTIDIAGDCMDQTPPEVTIVRPMQDSYTHDATPYFLIRYKEVEQTEQPVASGIDLSSLTIALDGVDRTDLFAVDLERAEIDLPDAYALEDGQHTVEARIKDNAGNEGVSASTFSLDTVPPESLTKLRAAPGSDQVMLVWHDSYTPEFPRVVVRRSTVRPPGSLFDGEQPTGELVTPQSYRDEHLTTGATYFYSVFALGADNEFLGGASVGAVTSADTDGDGLSDQYELETNYAAIFPETPPPFHTDPTAEDTDGDGISDGVEVADGADPTDPAPMPLPPPPPPPEPPPVPGCDPPILWAAYSMNNSIYLRETTCLDGWHAVFGDPMSDVRHTLVETTSPASRPSMTTHNNSQWLAWRDGNNIYAKAIWWGPGHTRTVYEGGPNTPSAPAIVSYDGKLVVVWAEGNQLWLTSSPFGVEWSTPVSKSFPAGTTIQAPALAVHQGGLFVGIVLNPTLYTVSVLPDLSWGPNHPVMTVSPLPVQQVSLASNGTQISMGFASGNQIFVTHSPTGYGGSWTPPIEIDSQPYYQAPPTLHYFNGWLYAVHPTGARFLMKRSIDGYDWVTPRFVVEPDATGIWPAAAVSSSTYSVVAPTPTVTLLNDSGQPASQVMNVVIFSEGYLESEMSQFQDLANQVADLFRGINPFSKNLDKFNIYRVELPSREKGADASPLMAAAVQQGVWGGGIYQSPVPGFQPRYTDTALGANYWACWEAPHYNTDVSETQSSPNNPVTPVCDAAEDLENPHTRITSQKALHIFGFYAYDLVENLIPGFDHTRDILFVIIDQDLSDGGTDKASYNPIVATHDYAVGLVYVHELAHFMVQLDDEDLPTCWPDVASDCSLKANKSANSNLLDPNHKWAHFFVNEGRPGDSILADPVSRPPQLLNYWDTSMINANSIFNAGIWATNGFNDWAWTGGTIIYGPSVRCMMNHSGLTRRFCPVCTEEVVKELHVRSGQTFVDADYHDTYNSVYVEYLHKTNVDPDYPKAGLISVNGNVVDVGQFYCLSVAEAESCSVDITNYVVNGLNTLIFHQQPNVTRAIDLLIVQVVNSNGAHMPIFPVTDLSGIGTPSYFSIYNWSTYYGDLQFEFSANLSGP